MKPGRKLKLFDDGTEKHKKRKLFVFKTETLGEQTTSKVFVDRLRKFA